MVQVQSNAVGTTYGTGTGMVFIFNLIVGTGALALPKVFAEAGYVIGGIAIFLLAFLSYLTVTYLIEVMSTTNAIMYRQKELKARQEMIQSDSAIEEDEVHVDESSSLLINPTDSYISASTIGATNNLQSYFEITERFELGQMAKMYFNKLGITLFYIVICLYLFGDLAIYAAAVPKTLRDVICTYTGNSTNETDIVLIESDYCWNHNSFSRLDMYRICVAFFAVCLCPFAFFNVQKTKYLQLFTTVLRWLSFSIMLALTLIRLFQGKGKGHPPVANFEKIPNLFGASVYSFMCHHSLPALVTPIKDKSKLRILFLCDYSMIMVFYLALSYTGIFAFGEVEDLYTLNFQPFRSNPITNILFLQYFLTLFPVFTLSTSFPIIAITLRGNIKSLFMRTSMSSNMPWMVDRIGFPLLAVVPPITVALITNDLKQLVGYTGSYAGALLQYAVPACLVYCCRQRAKSQLPPADIDPRYTPIHNSPFYHRFWVFIVLGWTILALGLVTADHFLQQ